MRSKLIIAGLGLTLTVACTPSFELGESSRGIPAGTEFIARVGDIYTYRGFAEESRATIAFHESGAPTEATATTPVRTDYVVTQWVVGTVLVPATGAEGYVIVERRQSFDPEFDPPELIESADSTYVRHYYNGFVYRIDPGRDPEDGGDRLGTLLYKYAPFEGDSWVDDTGEVFSVGEYSDIEAAGEVFELPVVNRFVHTDLDPGLYPQDHYFEACDTHSPYAEECTDPLHTQAFPQGWILPGLGYVLERETHVWTNYLGSEIDGISLDDLPPEFPEATAGPVRFFEKVTYTYEMSLDAIVIGEGDSAIIAPADATAATEKTAE